MNTGEQPWNSEEPVETYEVLFPLLPNYVVHDTVGNRRWTIGLKRGAPEHLRDNLFAAIVASTLDIGLSYAKQRYVTTLRPPPELGLTGSIDDLFDYGQTRFKYYVSFAKDAKKTHNASQELSIQFFYRNLASFDAAKRLAELGYLCEVAVILRTALEQFAFSAKLWDCPTGLDIKSVRPMQSLKHLRNIVPVTGRLYGLLSKYTHFEFEHHTHFFSVSPSRSFTFQRHSVLRAYATHLLFMTMACVAAYILAEASKHLGHQYKAIDELNEFIKKVDTYSDSTCRKLPRDAILAQFDILLQGLTLNKAEWRCPAETGFVEHSPGQTD